MKKLEIGDRYILNGEVLEIYCLDEKRSAIENEFVWKMKDVMNSCLKSISQTTLYEEAEFVGYRTTHSISTTRLNKVD
jgi:hypothetical protein